MIRLKRILKEVVPFQKADVVAQKLQKSSLPTLTPETFGIELEYNPGPPGDNINVLDYEDDIIRNMLNTHNWRASGQDAYNEWLQEKREYANNRYGRPRIEWNDSYGPIDTDTWAGHNPEPEYKDFEGNTDSADGDEDAFNVAHRDWDDARIDVDYEWNQFRRHWDSHSEEWAAEMIRDGSWSNYSNLNLEDLTGTDDIEYEIEQAREFIINTIGDEAYDSKATKDYWGVGPDGDNVEIRSKHLTESEFDKVRKILEFVGNKETAGDTSAHVHIGLPAKFDAFDIMAMSDLVDEEEIQKAIKGNRNYEQWARLNYDLAGDLLKSINIFFKNLISPTPAGFDASDIAADEEKKANAIEKIETGWIVKMDTLEKILKGSMRKFRGTNLSSFWDHRTIEFRYWSSEAAVLNPENFLRWIKYFLLLPKVAHKRNKIVIGPGRVEALVCSRNGANHVKIEFEEKFKEAVLKNYQKRTMKDKNQIMLPFA